ncbi:hypothetical protein BA950_07615 [Erythrobacter sp. SAORIC-644]|uniref:hypothetical protein n=1 Tax=Erythrobacter sp. SAORIC-644 TaxID=1869314 RepID=UPI000C9F0010|nr:hypothetical protein [Erythrobacter sp. SAORIC-644]PNQ76339.1 hypothetical protein BA950_07615 [Erythrobacter sp. SAORIC-644]
MVEALADAHNKGDIDLLSILTPETLEGHRNGMFFEGQTLYSSLIPKLSSDAAPMVAAVENLIQAAGNDGAAGLPANALAEWCEADPARPAEMLKLVDEGYEAADKFLTLTIRTGAQIDRPFFLQRAVDFTKNGSSNQQKAAIAAFGQIDPQTDQEWSDLVATFQEVRETADDGVTAALLSAATIRLKFEDCPKRAELETLIQNSLDDAGEFTLHQSADILWMSHAAISTSLKSEILNALLDLNPANTGTLDHLDHGLAELVEKGEVETVRLFLESLLKKTEGALEFKQFKSTRRSIHAADDHVFEDWVVDWFLKGDFELCCQMSDALFGAGKRETGLMIDFSRYELSDADHGYLARKAIGFLFLYPVVAASIIVSLIRSAPESVVPELEKLLLNPLLLNYSGVGKDYLKPIAKDNKDDAHQAGKRALKALDDYIDGLGALRGVKELRPSERQRQAEWQRHTDTMAEAQRKADEKSIFADLFTKVVVLYGKRTIGYFKQGKGAPKRIETQMASHGVSFEMPRVDIVDPVGLQQMLLSFRSEKRSK